MIRLKRIIIHCDEIASNMEQLSDLKNRLIENFTGDDAEVYFNFEDSSVKYNPKLGTAPRSFEQKK